MMSNRRALRNLSKQFPAPPEVEALFNAAHDQPDRIAGITLVAIVEAALEKLIVQALKHKEPEIVSALFENRGPLSDFNSKIIIAVAFGLVDRVWRSELDIIRHVRNTFAHAIGDVSFQTKEVSCEIRSAKIVKILIEHSLDAGNKTLFIILCRLLFLFIDKSHQYFGGGELASDIRKAMQEQK